MKSKLFSNVLAGIVSMLSPNCEISAQEQPIIIRIPTLGGTGMMVDGLNAKGQVTGFAYTSGNTAAHAFLFGTNGLTDLGTLGGRNSIGNAINSLGQVVGEADVPSNDGTEAFFWDGSATKSLGTLGGFASSAIGINDAGQAAGTSVNGAGLNEAFLSENGILQPLGDLGGGDSQAVAINQAGSVAGDSSYAPYEFHGFLYRTNKMTDLGTLGGAYSSVYALNNLDMVVGQSADTNGNDHAFLYSNEEMRDLGAMGLVSSCALAINDLGEVIGTASTANYTETRGFVYAKGLMTDLGTFGGPDTEPYAINNAGQVVGYGITADWHQHAFLWQNGSLMDLNTLLPPDSGWELNDARFINESGQIVGTGEINGAYAWYLFNPAWVNHAPIAEAGPNQTVECTASVILDGSGSSDPDGDTLVYEWSENGVVFGTEITLNQTFDLGTHYIVLKVADPSGASSEDTVIVQVVDTTPPIVTPPANASVPADASCDAAVPDFITGLVATDACRPAGVLNVTQTPASGTLLGVGPHPVTIVVTDPSGNTTTCNVLFTVLDAMAPVISAVSATPNQLTPPNHQLVPITISVVASDGCDASPASSIQSVTCNEQTSPDEIEITGPLSVNLAASRDPSGNGRIYRVYVQCVDASGNASASFVDVLVPKGHGDGLKPSRTR